jgi:hypothetical protein
MFWKHKITKISIKTLIFGQNQVFYAVLSRKNNKHFIVIGVTKK